MSSLIQASGSSSNCSGLLSPVADVCVFILLVRLPQFVRNPDIRLGVQVQQPLLKDQFFWQKVLWSFKTCGL